MSQSETSQVTFKALKPRYRFAIRLVQFVLSTCAILIISLANIGLVLKFGISPEEPFKDQTISSLWLLAYILQILISVPLVSNLAWPVTARVMGKFKKWPRRKVEVLVSSRKYPEEWAA